MGSNVPVFTWSGILTCGYPYAAIAAKQLLFFETLVVPRLSADSKRHPWLDSGMLGQNQKPDRCLIVLPSRNPWHPWTS